MLTIAYLANQFPSAVEPYVLEEINELRRRSIRVLAGTVKRPSAGDGTRCQPDIALQPVSIFLLLHATWLCLRRWTRISPLLRRVIVEGHESLSQRIKAVFHTWLGACYALTLAPHHVDHIHVHHGYFGSWIALTAARLLDTGFSMTLHGSDLLIHAAYLDVKLTHCRFCLTVSEYNRRYILENYPEVEPSKLIVSRLGVAFDEAPSQHRHTPRSPRFSLLAVGRLHEVKDHVFLVKACAQLHAAGADFECIIAGEGTERSRLESLIHKLDLDRQITLLGHVKHEQLDSLYDRTDLVVLTSRSEGLPLVLMEAMARGKIVLAPAITGIPELIIPGKTGFLYQPGFIDDFVSRVLTIRSLMRTECGGHFLQLEWVRHAARTHICQNFNRDKNLESFCDVFLSRITPPTESLPHENLVLQQI
jgi:colanic acid/amylovoran biosynthesis glycosyltransferase